MLPRSNSWNSPQILDSPRRKYLRQTYLNGIILHECSHVRSRPNSRSWFKFTILQRQRRTIFINLQTYDLHLLFTFENTSRSNKCRRRHSTWRMGQKIQISYQQYPYEVRNCPDHTISRVAHRIKSKWIHQNTSSNFFNFYTNSTRIYQNSHPAKICPKHPDKMHTASGAFSHPDV